MLEDGPKMPNIYYTKIRVYGLELEKFSWTTPCNSHNASKT
jgi:hypothetical protein